MPIAWFELPMSKNYDFTKTKDCLWIGTMECLTPSLHITRLSNSRNKIFYPSILDQEKRHFSQPRIGKKSKQSQVTNHTLKKPNDWWRLHLPLVISLKSTHIPIIHLRYDIPPHHIIISRIEIERHASVATMGGRAIARCRQTGDYTGDTQRVQPVELLIKP